MIKTLVSDYYDFDYDDTYADFWAEPGKTLPLTQFLKHELQTRGLQGLANKITLVSIAPKSGEVILRTNDNTEIKLKVAYPIFSNKHEVITSDSV